MRWIVLALVMLPGAASAEIYKCTGPDGKIAFSDKPCSAAEKAEAVRLPAPPESPYERRMREGAQRRAEQQALLRELNQQAEARRRARLSTYAARRAGVGVRVGMTALEVEKLPDWGPPNDINRTTTALGVREQWVYRTDEENEYERVYLYFSNGVLTTIQN